MSHVPVKHHVSLKHHLLVVSLLMAGLLTLLSLLVAAPRQAGPVNKEEPGAEAYLKDEEAVVIAPKGSGQEVIILPITKVLFEYIEINEGCGPHFEGACVNMRSGPGEDFPAVNKLRNGIVLKVSGKVERDGRAWYKIALDAWLRYPERATGDWYVAADYADALLNEGDRALQYGVKPSSTKRIVVERSTQKLYAYDGEELFMETSISTGIELTPTPRGTFTIFKKTPSRYMQGPIPGLSEKYYDLPGVPWNLYFTSGGAVIHGAYWHDNFGRQSSNGCVNLPPEQAKKLYLWADVGARVTVRD
ncbi:MAG: L,D-transpeptidase family protein [Candidatus Liptonbacteria bacterium]|nr:L,D-transpeptidase family protein [Candidatus Liptonbacteria bacterium]